MSEKSYFGQIGMPLSCTLFLEWALDNYKQYVKSVSDDTIEFVHEWNKVLVSSLKDSKYKPVLGAIGGKLVRYTSKDTCFGNKCIATAQDINVQSLHYALRFDKSIEYLRQKKTENPKLTFCDLGSGFSPLAVVFQNKYDTQGVYCVDIIPEIADIYTNAAYKLTGNAPKFITWSELQIAPKNKNVNTLVSVGCLPHMPKTTQKEYMKQINEKFDNFFLEIKYRKQDNIKNAENAFSLSDLQDLCLDFENIMDVEMAAARNALDYLRKFMHAKPNRADFITNCRSLFLSR